MEVKYQLKHVKEIRESGRCGAIYSYCINEDCDHVFENQEVLDCPECGTPRKVCGRWSIKGRERCGRHGGKSPSGIMSANYEGKGQSKNLPTKLFEYYQLSMLQGEGKILEMEDDIHVLEARKTQLKGQLGEEGADALWKEARRLYEKFTDLRVRASGGSTVAATQAAQTLDDLEAILVKGYAQSVIWEQLIDLIQVQTKIKESEIKRREKASTIVTEAQVTTLIGRIIGIIKERVKDQDTRKEILNDIQSMMMV